MNKPVKPLNNGEATFSPLHIVNGFITGADADGMASDSQAMQTAALSVLKCLYVTLSSPMDSETLSPSDAADVVALAAGVLELTQAIDDRLSETRGA